MGQAGNIDALRRAIDEAGGLLNRTAMAQLWGLSAERVRQLIERDDFPEPVTTVAGRPLWARAQVDAWRRRQLGEPKR